VKSAKSYLLAALFLESIDLFAASLSPSPHEPCIELRPGRSPGCVDGGISRSRFLALVCSRGRSILFAPGTCSTSSTPRTPIFFHSNIRAPCKSEGLSSRLTLPPVTASPSSLHLLALVTYDRDAFSDKSSHIALFRSANVRASPFPILQWRPSAAALFRSLTAPSLPFPRDRVSTAAIMPKAAPSVYAPLIAFMVSGLVDQAGPPRFDSFPSPLKLL